jgi:hypothetical protein
VGVGVAVGVGVGDAPGDGVGVGVGVASGSALRRGSSRLVGDVEVGESFLDSCLPGVCLPGAFGFALVFFFGLACAAFLHCFLAVVFVSWLHCLRVGRAPGAGLPPSAASDSRIASQLT